MSSLAQDILDGLKQHIDRTSDAISDNDTDHVIHTVTTNTNQARRYHLEKLVIHNGEAGAAIFSFWDGPSATGIFKYKTNVATVATLEVDFTSKGGSGLQGLIFETSVVVQADDGHANSYVTLLGYEI